MYKCPTCNETLIRKYILYGLLETDQDNSGYISGGCCVDEDSPKYGYECSVCKKVFILKQGQLLLQVDDEEKDEQ